MGGAEQQGAEAGLHGHAQSRPIERSHRHAMPPHPSGQGFYHHHPQGNVGAHPHPHALQQQYHPSPAYAEYQRTKGTERYVGEGRMQPPPAGGQYGDEWEDEEDEDANGEAYLVQEADENYDDD